MTALVGGKLHSIVVQDVAHPEWLRCIYGVWTDFEPMLAKLHTTNEVLLLGTVDKPHCVRARDSTRAGGLHCRSGPQGRRVAAGMTCSGALSRGGGQIYSIPRMDEPSHPGDPQCEIC